MGYISDYTKFIFIKNLDKEIVSDLYKGVIDDCVNLIERGYESYFLDKSKIFY